MNAKQSKAVRVAIFNHKGGVGKTTLTVNLAMELSRLGKRVLLVDTDPQCNLTSYLFDDDVVDDLLDNSDNENGRTVWSAIKPVVEGTGGVNTIEPYELPSDNLFLIPGDIRLSEFEAELGNFWSQCIERKTRGFLGTTALSKLVGNTAQELDADYIFYDAGPNIGPLNRVILLDCDYFVVAMACDLFSVRALSTLGRSMATWVKDWKIISDLAPEGLDALVGLPKMLGYILQNFRMYGGRVAAQHRSFLPRIERSINSQIVNVLAKIDGSLVSEFSGKKLGEVKDFGSLASASQKEGVSFSNVKAGTENQRKQAAAAFHELAQNLIERTNPTVDAQS